MAEYIVKKLLRELADVAITELRKEFQLVIGVEAEVQNLSSKLELIRKMLRDALEKGRLKKDDAVGTWLGKLEDVAYDADDVLEEWSTQVQKLKVEADDDEDPNSPNSQQLNKAAIQVSDGIRRQAAIQVSVGQQDPDQCIPLVKAATVFLVPVQVSVGVE